MNVLRVHADKTSTTILKDLKGCKLYMPKISVIMPSLNVVKYIRQCMNSVIHQTLEDLEIISIDAGSSDGTAEILAEYAEKDSRIKLIKSDKRSYGYQMNLGISMAQGEYIGIVETDDVVEPDMFEALYEKINEEKPDYVKGTAKGFFDLPGGGEFQYDIIPCKNFIIDKTLMEVKVVPKETPQLFWNDNFLWNGIYRTDFLRKVRFNETPGAAFQDIGALFQIISSAESAVYIRKSVYKYRRTNSEASSYNKSCVNFVNSEYEYIEQYLAGKPAGWIHMYYKKMLGLLLNRFDFMVMTGQYWEESEDGIRAVTKKLKKAFEANILYDDEDKLIENNKDRIRFLFTNHRKLFKYDQNILNRKRALYNEIIEKCIGRSVVIFGAQYYGRFLQAYLGIKGGVSVKAFCDNNPKIQGSVIGNVEILSLDDCLKLFPDSFYITASKLRGEEIKEQLIQNGVKNEDIYIYQEAPDILLLIGA